MLALRARGPIAGRRQMHRHRPRPSMERITPYPARRAIADANQIAGTRDRAVRQRLAAVGGAAIQRERRTRCP